MFKKINSKIHKIREINSIAIDTNFNPSILNSFYIIRRGILKGIHENKHFLSGRLLDFGCGSKPYKPIFYNVREYIGLDYYNEGHSHENEDIDLFYDGKNIPFENGSFDSILSTEVFEHVFNLDELLTELNRVLKPEGFMLITCPFVYPEHETPFDYARYTQFALRHLLEKNGFDVVVADKKGNVIETICQQLVIYSSAYLKLFGPLKRSKLFIKLFNGANALFFNLFAKTVGKLLPSTYHLYSTNIIVAKKVKSLV
jgi:SAM-dependent methyltransferase